MRLFFYLSQSRHPSIIEDIYYGFSGPAATLLHKIRIPANAVTIFRGLLLFYVLYCFSRGEYSYYLQGSLLLILNTFLDFVDGDLARLNNSESELGEWLEMLTGNPIACMHGLVGFSIAWGVYQQTGMIEVWYVLFFISYGVILNPVVRSFSFHTTKSAASLREGFQKEYDSIMRYPVLQRLYFTLLQVDEFILLLSIIFYRQIDVHLGINPVFLALLVMCVIYQTRWLLRVALQAKYFVSKYVF